MDTPIAAPTPQTNSHRSFLPLQPLLQEVLGLPLPSLNTGLGLELELLARTHQRLLASQMIFNPHREWGNACQISSTTIFQGL
jgi:hypothetical protein